MKLNIREFVFNFIKGVAMGAANVIPGVSGGTIALITGIYERLINALKSFDLKAVKLLFRGKIGDLIKHIDLIFLISVLFGVALSVITLSKLLGYLFENYPVLLWAFFFGLILASIYFVGKAVKKWGFQSILFLLIGVFIASAISFLTPANENASAYYLFICGIVVICSMILPGLSGSFVLIIMGNYFLLLNAVTDMNLGVLIPTILGCVIGLIAFSHLLSWVFAKFHDISIASLTGFILGSLIILWPWKSPRFLLQSNGEIYISKGKERVIGYDWQLPEVFGGNYTESFPNETLFAIGLILAGIIVVLVLERLPADMSS